MKQKLKQITKPLAVEVTTKSGYIAVLERLESLGFTHCCNYSHDYMMADWDDYRVFDISRIPSKTYGRNSSPKFFNNIIPASQFLAEYGVEEPAAAPAAPLNPPNFVVDTGRNETLSRMVQELAFSVGMLWTDGSDRVANEGSAFLYLIRGEKPFPYETKGIMHSNGSSPTPAADQWPLYSAATQMGEIVRLLSTPVTPPVPPAPTPPSVHGRVINYSPGSSIARLGDTKLSVKMLRDSAKLMGAVIDSDGSVMENAGVIWTTGQNSIVNSVNLFPDFMSLDLSQIKEILRHVSAVHEYAKKHPSTSTPTAK